MACLLPACGRGPSRRAGRWVRARSWSGGLLRPHLLGRALQAVVAARRRGSPVFCETRPAYLFLDDSTVRHNARAKQRWRYACRRCGQSKSSQRCGTGCVRATSKPSAATTQPGWPKRNGTRSRSHRPVPAGFGGVQTSFPLLFGAGVLAGRLSIRNFMQVSSANPSKLFGLWPAKGRIAPAATPTWSCSNPDAPVTVEQSMLESRSDFDVYTGLSALGWPAATISRGEVIWQDGTVAATPSRTARAARPRRLSRPNPGTLVRRRSGRPWSAPRRLGRPRSVRSTARGWSVTDVRACGSVALV